MEGVCSLRLPQRSLVDGLVGFECRHLAASRWTPREGPNSCPTLVVVVVGVGGGVDGGSVVGGSVVVGGSGVGGSVVVVGGCCCC